jgi:hypothetical protein
VDKDRIPCNFTDKRAQDAALRILSVANMSRAWYEDLAALCGNAKHPISEARRRQLERRKLLVNGNVPRPVRFVIRTFESSTA